MARYLIVNADDLGLSPGINRGIAAAHDRGVVTSASLMVLQRAAEEAVAWAEGSDLSLGIHVDLCEWVHHNGEWKAVYQRVDTDDEVGVRREVERQLDRFVDLCGRLPSHMDSHQHVHMSGAAGVAISRCAEERRLLLRGRSPVHFQGSFYGQDEKGVSYPDLIDAAALIRIVADLRSGWTELSCHPGFAGDAATTYRWERHREVEALCDRRVQSAIRQHRIQLTNYSHATWQPPVAAADECTGGSAA